MPYKLAQPPPPASHYMRYIASLAGISRPQVTSRVTLYVAFCQTFSAFLRIDSGDFASRHVTCTSVASASKNGRLGRLSFLPYPSTRPILLSGYHNGRGSGRPCMSGISYPPSPHWMPSPPEAPLFKIPYHELAPTFHHQTVVNELPECLAFAGISGCYLNHQFRQ